MPMLTRTCKRFVRRIAFFLAAMSGGEKAKPAHYLPMVAFFDVTFNGHVCDSILKKVVAMTQCTSEAYMFVHVYIFQDYKFMVKLGPIPL